LRDATPLFSYASRIAWARYSRRLRYPLHAVHGGSTDV